MSRRRLPEEVPVDGLPYPFTQRRERESVEVWAQREYVEAARRGVGFAAHGEIWNKLFHYHEKPRGRTVTLVVGPTAPVLALDHGEMGEVYWMRLATERARAFQAESRKEPLRRGGGR